MAPTDNRTPFPDDPPLAPRDWGAIVLALVLPTIVTWLYFIVLDGQQSAGVAAAIGKGIQFALPIVWVCLVQRRKIRWELPKPAGLGLGLFFGLAVMGAMIGLYFAWLQPQGVFDEPADAMRAKLKSFGIASLTSYAALALFYSLVHSLAEEYYWRWFVFRQLARGTTLPWAIVTSSVGFAAHHVLVLGKYFGYDSPLTWIFSAGVAIGGAAWAWLYARSGSLLGPWLAHALVDATIFVVGWQIMRSA